MKDDEMAYVTVPDDLYPRQTAAQMFVGGDATTFRETAAESAVMMVASHRKRLSKNELQTEMSELLALSRTATFTERATP